MSEGDLVRTALFDAHVERGGNIVDFHGFELPIWYTSMMDEHLNTRDNAGLFDVSHMGRLDIQGSSSSDFLNRTLSVDVIKLKPNRARYGVICNIYGGIIDDCIVYKFDADHFLLVPNASNKTSVIEWLNQHTTNNNVSITDITNQQAMIAHLSAKSYLDLTIYFNLTN